MSDLKIYKVVFYIAMLTNTPLHIFAQFSNHNLLFWLRSDTALVTSGSSVNNWNDVSGNNFNFYSVTPPVVSTNSLTGLKSVMFDNNNLMSNNSTSVNNFNAFIVYKKTDPPIFYERLMDHNYANGFWVGRNGNINHNFGSGYKSTSPPVIVSGNFPDTVANICIVSKNHNSYKLYNGSALIDNQSISDFSPTSLNKITIGCDLSLTGNFKGDIFEVVFFNDTISNRHKDSVLQYLYKKYAPKPNLGPDVISANSFCPTTLNVGNRFTDVLWSTGATTSSISVNMSGLYWVKTRDIFGRFSYDSINVSYPGSFLNQNVTLCQGASLIWNTQLNKHQYTFQWQDYSTDSLLTITQPGQYFVTVSDPYGCAISSHTITVAQDNYPSSVSLGPDISLCSGNYITLTSGAAETLSYTWNDQSHNDSLLILNSGQYSVIVTNTNNCTAKDTIHVAVLGQAPIPNYTVGIACKRNAVAFTNLSSTASGNTIISTIWDFGDPLSATSNTSTLSNPFHTFSDTGTYSVKLNVTTNAGCEKSITKKVHVAPSPTVNFGNGVSCQNDSTSFAGFINGSSYPVVSFLWNFGDPASGIANTSSLSAPKHLFSNQTNYTVKLVATNIAGCKDSISKLVAVRAQVTASFTYNPACLNKPTLFQDNSIVPSPSNAHVRTWNFGTTTSTGLTATKIYSTTGVYSVTLTVAGTNGCTSKISKLVSVFFPPVASFSAAAFCSKDTITITNLSNPKSGILSSYHWEVNQSLFSTVQTPTLSLTSAGTYSIKLVVANSFQCQDSITKPVTALPLPNVDFVTTPTTYYYVNLPITFTPTIANSSLYQWNINGMSYPVPSPTIAFANTGTYSASLYIKDTQGCGSTKQKLIVVSPRFLDLAILNIRSSLGTDQYFNVETDLANLGFVPVSTFDISQQISDAGTIKETKNVTINPGEVFTYVFASKLLSKTNNHEHPITCVTIGNINQINDNDVSNNQLCMAEDSENTVVLDPYPNPSDNDITVPVFLNKEEEYSLEIFSATGQVMMGKKIEKGVKGLNLVLIPDALLNQGYYLLNVTINEKLYIKKILKTEAE